MYTLLRVAWAYEDLHLEFPPVPIFNVQSHQLSGNAKAKTDASCEVSGYCPIGGS